MNYIKIFRHIYKYLRNHVVLMKLIAFIFRPLVRFKFFYYYCTCIDRVLGLSRVLVPGDIAIQAGVMLDWSNDSQLWYIAKIIKENGTVVIIEPDPENMQRIKETINKNNFKCRFIFINKAVYSKKSKMKFLLGIDKKDNMLDCVPGSSSWKGSEKYFTSRTILVETDTIDNILAENDIDYMEISYINLTINGAEHEALKGMTNLLESSKNLSVTVIAGRRNYGEADIGFVDGKLDYIATADFLSKFGFRVKFRRFDVNSFGYVIGTKGRKKVFM